MTGESRILRQDVDFGPVTGPSGATRVLVLAAARIYREGIASALRRTGGFVVDELAAEPAAALEAFTSSRPDVAVLDLGMEAAAAIVGAATHHERSPAIVGLVLSDDPSLVVGAAALGVRAFIAADQSLDELVDTVSSAAAGSAACPPTIAGLLFEQLQRTGARSSPPGGPLTSRELEIAGCLVRGLSNKEIARLLVIEPATVKNHVHNVLTKLGASRRAEVGHVLRGIDRSVHSGPDLP